MPSAATGVLLAAGLGAGICWSYLAVRLLSRGGRKESILAPLMLATWILTVALRNSIDMSASLSGIKLEALDVVTTLMLAVGLARLVSKRITRGRGLVLALVVLIGIHISRGILTYGLQKPINDARSWVYFVAALIYGVTLPASQRRQVWRFVTATGFLLAAIATPYILLEGIHPATQMVLHNGHLVTSRPIVATGALLILEAAILAPALDWPRPKVALRVSAFAGLVVLLLEHRTLWVAGLVVAVVAFVSWVKQARIATYMTRLGSLAAVALLLPVAVWGFAQSNTLVASASEATSSKSTFTWRTTSWQELLAAHHSVAQTSFGEPSGETWSRSINGQVFTEAPHDDYVEAYLRFGLPGLAILLVLGWRLWRGRYKVDADTDEPGGTVVGLIIIAQAIFAVAYSLDLVQGLIAGLLVAGVLGRERITSSLRPLGDSTGNTTTVPSSS